MTRQRYTISQPDLPSAVAYLRTKLLNPAWPSDVAAAQVRATRSFKKASRDPVTLTAWCDKHLTAAQLTRLKAAVRQARKRTADLSRDKPKSVTLSRQAWRILSDLAKANNVTLSQVIETRLSEEWRKI